MLSLGTELRFGVGSLLPITLALGTCGIVQVNRLGPPVDVILRENYRSVLAMQRSTEALEHQDTGLPSGHRRPNTISSFIQSLLFTP
jgi:hypothetical protein